MKRRKASLKRVQSGDVTNSLTVCYALDGVDKASSRDSLTLRNSPKTCGLADHMGLTFSSLWARLFLRKETKVLILGLDNAGKSTILYRITMGSVVASAPTVGSNHEIYDYKGVRFGLIDIGGQTSLRASWNQYFIGTSAIILVIDSSDAGRLPLAKAELQKLTQAEELKTSLLLVLANKQDLPLGQGRLTPAQVSEALGLTDLRQREWQIMGCSALTGEGLFEGMDWLVGKLAAGGG